MNTQRQEEISLPLALSLLVGVGCLAWFLLLPGKLDFKWNEITTYLVLKEKEIMIALGVIAINLALTVGAVISLTGAGRLGQKIRGYYLKKQKLSFTWAIFSLWPVATIVCYMVIDRYGDVSPLLPMPLVIPSWQSTQFLRIVALSEASLMGLIIASFTHLTCFLCGLSGGKIPKLPEKENILTLGTINER